MNIKSEQLKNIAEVNPKFSNQDTYRSDTKVSFIPMASVSEMSGRIICDDEKLLDEVSNGFTYFRRDDVLVAKITPCFENGKIAIACIKNEIGFGSTEFHVIRPYVDVLDSKYLFYFLRQPKIRIAGEMKMTGSAGQRRVPKHFIEGLEIPLLPLAEQHRIAAILDKAEFIREKRRRAIATLDELVQSVFIDMFGDPVTNPMGWKILKFAYVGKLDRGKSKHRPRNAPELLGGLYPIVQTGDIANANKYVRKYTQTYSEFGLLQSKMWKAGTLCITIAANIANTAILTFDACFPDSVVGFIPNEQVTTEYVQYWLSFLQETIEESAPESAQKNINLKILRELDIPVPPVDLQQKFTSIVNAIESTKMNMQQSEKALFTLFSSLQHRAFTGELTSDEIEYVMASMNSKT